MKQYLVILKIGKEFKISQADFDFLKSIIKHEMAVSPRIVEPGCIWCLSDTFVVNVNDIAAVIPVDNGLGCAHV